MEKAIKVKGFKLTQTTINQIDELALDYRNNKSMLIEKLVEAAFNAKITKDETTKN